MPKKRNLATKILQFFDTLNIKRVCPSCPCGEGAMLRYIKCNEKETDGLRLHFEKCNACGFEVYKDRVNEIPIRYKKFLKQRSLTMDILTVLRVND